ncbi:MAG: serine/threonine protein kinase, partial [Deltaproteobacteria bacterium]|nr:serine/threonine protein kinase [Deltaproteobacteria bacterium]
MRSEDVETGPVVPKPPARRRSPTLARGTCVGRYVIFDRLGLGGMGVVYRAYDPDLDRRVALKLVRAVTQDTTARLIREAKALAKVSHPNIVQIFDVGVFGETVFIAMELVEGRTLLQWNRETRPAWRVILAHVIEAGRGLAAAHAAGLVHRDFKPHNTIVGADGRVRVLDFGLARLAVARVGESTEVAPAASGRLERPVADAEADADSDDEDSDDTTRPAQPADSAVADDEPGLPRIVVSRITGTPIYMAPEQRRQKVLDARTDQFAFAVTCWELLYGERPFQGETLKHYADAAAAGRFRPPPAGNETPSWVRRVLLRALSAAPSDRYRSMDDVLTALAADPARRRRKVAVIALAALAFAARGRWQLGRVVSLLGLLAIAVSLLVDMPTGLDEGKQAIAYAGVEAKLIEGFYAQFCA